MLPRIHPMRLRIAKPFNDAGYIFELKAGCTNLFDSTILPLILKPRGSVRLIGRMDRIPPHGH